MPQLEDTPVSPLYAYSHDHPDIQNVNDVHDSGLTAGQRIADKVAALVGSWPFIIVQSVLLFIWIILNIYLALHPEVMKAFDPYPFILLNLALSFQAAYTGPIVMMSQNRQSEKDRLMAQSDFQCNKTAEEEIRLLMEHLKHQDKIMDYMVQKIETLEQKLSGQSS